MLFIHDLKINIKSGIGYKPCFTSCFLLSSIQHCFTTKSAFSCRLVVISVAHVLDKESCRGAKHYQASLQTGQICELMFYLWIGLAMPSYYQADHCFALNTFLLQMYVYLTDETMSMGHFHLVFAFTLPNTLMEDTQRGVRQLKYSNLTKVAAATNHLRHLLTAASKNKRCSSKDKSLKATMLFPSMVTTETGRQGLRYEMHNNSSAGGRLLRARVVTRNTWGWSLEACSKSKSVP